MESQYPCEKVSQEITKKTFAFFWSKEWLIG